jgi:hypothetical protein
MLRKFASLDFWAKIVTLYLMAGFVVGKGSAYIALLIGGLLLFSPKVLWNPWYIALTRSGQLLNKWAWALLISLLLGFAELGYGLYQGYSVITSLEVFCFTIWPLYVFLGMRIGERHPEYLRYYMRYSAWFIVFFAPIYFLFLSKLNVSLSGLLPGNDMVLLGNPGSGSTIIMGLIAYEPHLAQFWIPLLVLSCLTIANQERSDWVGLILAMMIWGYLAKKMNRVFGIAALIAAVLIVAALIDLKLPAVAGRGGELSARGTISRMAGSISPELAQEVGGNAANARFYYGTVYWRKRWWAAIRAEVGKETKSQIIGLGYGYPIAKLNADPGTQIQKTRSPHNILYFCYAYSGWVGILVFAWLVICMFDVLWKVYKINGTIYGLTFFAYQIVQALFGNSIETPQAGIVVYLMVGLTIGTVYSNQPDQDPEFHHDLLYDENHLAPRSETEVLEHARGD